MSKKLKHFFLYYKIKYFKSNATYTTLTQLYYSYFLVHPWCHKDFYPLSLAK